MRDRFEENISELLESGYTLLDSVLTGEQCAEACEELERIFDEEKGLPGVSQGTFTAESYSLMNKARIFETFYTIPRLLRIVRHFLGADAVLSSIHAHRISPGASAQRLHYDGTLFGPFKSVAPADESQRIVEFVLGLNVAFCVTRFSPTNGATRVVPRSHRFRQREVTTNGEQQEITVEAPRGSVLIFNIALWHGATANTSDETRYAVMTPWRRSWIRPEADLSLAVHPDVLERAGEEGQRIFGIASRAPYLDRWQWDWKQGRPRNEWKHLSKAVSKD